MPTLRSVLIFLLILSGLAFIVHAQQATVPIGQTHSLQNGISLGMGIWATPDPTLQGLAVTACSPSGTMATCISANQAVQTDAQNRGLAFLNDVYANYTNADTSLGSRNLWFQLPGAPAPAPPPPPPIPPHVKFLMLTQAGAADPMAMVSVFVADDGNPQMMGAGVVTNLGNGQYDYAPTSTEWSGKDVGIEFTAMGDLPLNFDFHPR